MTLLSRVSLLAAAMAVASVFGTSAQAMTAPAQPTLIKYNQEMAKPLQEVGYRRGYYRGGYARRGYYDRIGGMDIAVTMVGAIRPMGMAMVAAIRPMGMAM